uniref:Uncharacterized protein n=1 Tax=Setaria italica TaxID=4555 RepID=K4A458_SETIT
MAAIKMVLSGQHEMAVSINQEGPPERFLEALRLIGYKDICRLLECR